MGTQMYTAYHAFLGLCVSNSWYSNQKGLLSLAGVGLQLHSFLLLLFKSLIMLPSNLMLVPTGNGKPIILRLKT